MDAKGLQNYKAQSLTTMTQGELLLLLMDELVKRLMRSDIALEQGDMQLFEASIQRCIDIVRYLDDTLDRRYEVSRGLHRLYDFFCYDLNRISLGRNKKELDKLRPMITDLRDTFRIAEKNASGGN
ncbi:MAG: flagellar protein FliS [Oscillospiraceae bacterium]|nr:flagellar protein FliS [Oscillospiraceae bacterium]